MGLTYLAPKQAPLTAIGLMLAAMAILPMIDVIAKFLGEAGVPILQIVWSRMVFGAVLALPFAVHAGGKAALLPDRPLFHLFRSALLITATFTFFLSLTYLPIADALAIFFVQPLVLTALSPIVLGERVGPRRWAAVFVGFVGMLIIIRPGLVALNPGSLLALAAGTSLALYMLATRRIAGRAPAMVTTFHTSLMGAVLASAFVGFVWQTPTPTEWAMFAALGVIASVGHYLIVRAYDHAEASLLAPLAYTEMVMATALGWWFFDDLPDRWTILGVSILIACAIYIAMRERAQAKAAGLTLVNPEPPDPV
jgi:drug/metabolite transporter (DMT)-like permease